MRAILYRERLHRILGILARYPDGVSVRTFARSFSVWAWEVEQATHLGFVKIEIRKPYTGRPSRVAMQVSETQAAKLPPYRASIPRPIRWSTWLFARHATRLAEPFGLRRASPLMPRYRAWMECHPKGKSEQGARASASRVRRKLDVIAAVQWTFAWQNGELPLGEERFPESAAEVWLQFKALGSWRASHRWKPSSWQLAQAETFIAYRESLREADGKG